MFDIATLTYLVNSRYIINKTYLIWYSVVNLVYS